MKNNKTKLDILAFGAHPDDVEAGCAGFLIKQAQDGKKIGIVDLSLAELSTNGTVKERLKEADEGRKIIGAVIRDNLEIPNNFFENSKNNQSKIIEVIRKYKPQMVLLPYWIDRHPDHENVYKLVWPALFTGGLVNFETGQKPHRPDYVFFYRLWHDFKPTFIFDISDVFDKKLKSMLAYKSQFVSKKGTKKTRINDDSFLESWKARYMNYGHEIGVKYGEPYLSLTPLGVKDLRSIIPNYF